MKPMPGFLGPSYEARINALDIEQTINLIPELVTSGRGRAVGGFMVAPGLRLLTTIGNGPHRGSYEQDGRAWCVSGREVYEVLDGWLYVLRGTVESDQGLVSWASSGVAGNQLMLVSAGYGYVLNLTTNVLTQIADVDFPANATLVVWFESYFVVLVRGVAAIYFSLADATVWSAIDVSQKSLTSDGLVSLVVDGPVLWLLGPKRSEAWSKTGDTNNPLAPIPNVVTEDGCGATYSPILVAKTPMWLLRNERGGRSFVKANGYQTAPVSTPAVEWAWSQYERSTDVECWSYEQNGHAYAMVTFPTPGKTWCYDAATNWWHERGHFTLGHYLAHRARTHMYAFDTHVVGSRTDGALYALDPSTYDGTTNRWLRRFQGPDVGGRRVTYPAAELVCSVGVGLTTGQGSNPLVGLRMSDDAGKTWSSEYLASLGKIGQYATRVRWTQLGQAEGPMNWELVGSDPVFAGLVDFEVDARLGLH